jgi:hypothetical protein
MKYVDQGAAVYEAQHRQLQIKHLKWKAAKLGFQIVQARCSIVSEEKGRNEPNP